MHRLIAEMEMIINQLGQESAVYDMDVMTCDNCPWRTLDKKTLRGGHVCPNCSFYSLVEIKNCYSKSRIGDFLDHLMSLEIWPLSRHLDDIVEVFQVRLTNISTTSWHTCSGKSNCPLRKISKIIADRFGTILKSFEKSLDLQIFKKGGGLIQEE